MPNASDNVAPYRFGSIPATASSTTSAAVPESGVRTVRLFRNGANQAVRIPKEFELPGEEALIRRVGNTLVIEPVPPRVVKGSAASLAEALATMEDIDEPFPEVDEGLRLLDEVDLR